ncbi:hypothetical protein [Halomonas caseinilytica]|uniref:Uncharacterized protein n=1 Tax=Halomonas caseinilytica TaxID=438744 RepID=A0A1M6YPS4_9GAMM|nr:hypothetical protein [Halomonas caseinilytica]SEN12370.1 hypothetical protein SAMN04487952_11074 [Halomonas caseinilytica]SHL20095.1 hypothetical protein SAMN05192556_10953 [Halomonas caseinilytica]
MARGNWHALLIAPFAVLAGCQATPTRMPEAEPAPAAACHWPVEAGSRSTTLARVVEVLEQRDFLVRDTDTSLGLVSAERAGRTLYHDAVDPAPRLGGFLFGGSGGHVASGVGLGIGFGGAGWPSEEATRIERVSVVVGGESVRVSRDVQLYDWRGQLRQSRTASDANFCRELHDAVEAGEVSS